MLMGLDVTDLAGRSRSPVSSFPLFKDNLKNQRPPMPPHSHTESSRPWSRVCEGRTHAYSRPLPGRHTWAHGKHVRLFHPHPTASVSHACLAQGRALATCV